MVNTAASIYVVAGGASGTMVEGGFDAVAGTAVGATIESGGTLHDYGVTSHTTVNSGG